MTRIRYATQEDALSLRQAFVEVVEPLEVYNEAMRAEQLAKYTAQHFVDLIVEDSGSVAVAEDADGRLLGFIVTALQGGPIWIEWICILSAARGKHVGESLIEFALREATARGGHKYWCDTRADNVPAIRLFEKMGFTQKCRFDDHWQRQAYLLWEKFI
jgi:ribosomal protein S18 acetylase RimI-like enzyme